MKRISIGDLFSINTPKGKAYLQFIHKDDNNIEMVRVLNGLFSQEIDLFKLVKGNEKFLICFPLLAAYKKKIIEFVGNYPIPENFCIPKHMRSAYIDQNGKLVHWDIVDINTLKRQPVSILTEEQKKLSPWGIWNDTLLIERLCEDWSLGKWI